MVLPGVGVIGSWDECTCDHDTAHGACVATQRVSCAAALCVVAWLRCVCVRIAHGPLVAISNYIGAGTGRGTPPHFHPNFCPSETLIEHSTTWYGDQTSNVWVPMRIWFQTQLHGTESGTSDYESKSPSGGLSNGLLPSLMPSPSSSLHTGQPAYPWSMQTEQHGQSPQCPASTFSAARKQRRQHFIG